MTGPRSAVRRLAGARVVSMVGTGAATVALLITMYNRTHSAVWVSGTLVATHGVQVFLALFTSGLGDRFDRRGLMIASEIAGGVCYGVMALLDAPVALLAVALLGAVAGSPFHSSSAAAIPNLVGPEEISWANSMVSVGRNLGMTLGPILGGTVTAALGPNAVFAVNAVSFLASAAVIASVHGRFSGDRTAAASTSYWDVHAGLSFLWRDRLLRTLLMGEAILVLGLGLIQVARVPLVKSFGRGSAALGLLDGLWGAGLLLGALAGRALNARREPVTFVVGLAGVAVATMAVGVSPWFGPILGFNFLIGLSDSMDLLAGQGIRQRRTPDAVLSRVIAANSSLCVLAQMAGYGASGVLIPIVGPQGVYAVSGAVVAVSAVLCFPAIRLARRPAADEPIAEPLPQEANQTATHLPVT